MEELKMPVRIFEHIKGSEFFDLLKELNPDPEKTFRIIIEPENEFLDEEMPPEEMLQEELIEETERRSKEYREGEAKGILCKTEEEVDTFFQKILEEKE